ncbi:MAG: hypothetical protein M0R73_04015 [Dehalococcoidia bacterium]|nr:hypothetical protein [Dehalococcoidia bacterium]
MPLVPILREEALRRGLLDADEGVDAATAFRLVRDMPYRRASDRQPETILREWRGTCSGKHYLLRDLLREIGMPSTVILATHEFTPDNSPWLPPHLMTEAILAPVPDVHNFLRVQYDPADDQWMTVDCTWPSAARRLEMPANLSFEPGVDQRIACDPIEIFHVPEDQDPQALKEEVLADHVGQQAARRDAFINGLSDWVERELGQ